MREPKYSFEKTEIIREKLRKVRTLDMCQFLGINHRKLRKFIDCELELGEFELELDLIVYWLKDFARNL